MSDNTRKIIDFTLGDQGKEAREALYAEIHDRVMDKFEHLKTGIASAIITGESFIPEAHDDEKEDKALVKKMVKKDCLTKEGIEDTEEEYDEDEEDEDSEWDEELVEELSQYTVEEIQEFMQTEDFEQLDELSKTTMGSYLQKALSQKMSGSAKKDRVPGMQKAYKNIAYKKTTTK
jgi:hypothetical protein